MIDDRTWDEVRDRLPVGATVRGVVEKLWPFGIAVRLDEFPTVPAVVDVVDYRPRGAAVAAEHWPEEGTLIEAVVVDHTEFNRQVKLRIGPAWTAPP
jgi:ribosomal protein S1